MRIRPGKNVVTAGAIGFLVALCLVFGFAEWAGQLRLDRPDGLSVKSQSPGSSGQVHATGSREKDLEALCVVVRDAKTGNPIPGAWIRTELSECVTDDFGIAALYPVPKGGSQVLVLARLYAPLAWICRGDASSSNEIHLTPGGIVRGVVVDIAGRPLPGTFVVLSRGCSAATVKAKHGRAGAILPNDDTGGYQLTATADGNGAFEFVTVGEGLHVVEAALRNHVHSQSESGQIAAGASVVARPGDELEIKLTMARVWQASVGVRNKSMLSRDELQALLVASFSVPRQLRVPSTLAADAVRSLAVIDHGAEADFVVAECALETEASAGADQLDGVCRIGVKGDAFKPLQVTWTPVGATSMRVDTDIRYELDTGWVDITSDVRLVLDMLDQGGKCNGNQIAMDSGLRRQVLRVPVGTYLLRPVVGFASDVVPTRQVVVGPGEHLQVALELGRAGRLKVSIKDSMGNLAAGCPVRVVRGSLSGFLVMGATQSLLDVEVAPGTYSVFAYSPVGQEIGSSTVEVLAGQECNVVVDWKVR